MKKLILLLAISFNANANCSFDANGFMYIFDVTNSGTFAYMSSKSVDVLPLVKKNLGLQ